MNNTSSTIIADTGLTTEEITRALRHLSVTRGFLIESVGRLSPAQWDFKPAEDSWSIAEVMEHVVLIETSIHGIIDGISAVPDPAAESKRSEMDEFILKEIPKRTRKRQCSADACPTGRWSGPESLERFVKCREHTTQLLLSRRLREQAFPHPYFGSWDGYQWLLAAGSHGARHTEQMREVKAHQNFPSLES